MGPALVLILQIGASSPRATARSSNLAAAAALVLESIDARLAVEAWERYITAAGTRGPWIEHAQKRLESLRKRGRGG